MANPTTNYGFVLPTSTDLVTDLPADFDVALQGVDTRLKALQPGTTLGDLAYSSATANTNTRLAIGTNSQVLTVAGGVPTWATPAAASSGLTLIHTETLSAVSSVNIDSKFTSTYVNYLILANIEQSTSNSLKIQYRSGGSTITTGYKQSYFFLDYTNNTLSVSSSTSAPDIYEVSSNTDRKLLTMTIGDPQTTEFTKSQILSTDNAYNVHYFGIYPQTTSIDGIRFSATTGNMTGTVRIYGYQNS
jgi:hypothetical protein